MKKLRSIAIETAEQVEAMRRIYNENLDLLATSPIPFRNYDDQQEWWRMNKHRLRAFLYEPLDRPGKAVAFLVLTDRGLFDTPIIALKKEEWGSGYGQEIVRDYIEKANRPLAGSQLQSNKAICHINRKVGWRIIGEKDQPGGKVDLLFHPGVNSQAGNQDEVYQAVLRHHGIQ